MKECLEADSVSLVCRRYRLPSSNVHGSVRKHKATDSSETLPRDTRDILSHMFSQIRHLSGENAILKKVVAEKEIQMAILRKLIEKANQKQPTGSYRLQVNPLPDDTSLSECWALPIYHHLYPAQLRR